MDFFSVWWYDLLLVLAVLPQILRFFLCGTGQGFGWLTFVSVLLQLASIVALPFIGCELTDALIVLMLYAAVSSGLAFVESRLGRGEQKSEDKEGETP